MPDTDAGRAERLQLLQQVDDRVETILSTYASSDVALQLILGETVGPISRAGLARAIEDAEAALRESVDDTAARGLFVQASLLLEELDSIEVRDRASALHHALAVRSIMQLVEQIVEAHETSDLAMSLEAGTQVGQFTQARISQITTQVRRNMTRYCNGDLPQICLFDEARAQIEPDMEPRQAITAMVRVASLRALASDSDGALALFGQAYEQISDMDAGVTQSSAIDRTLRAQVNAGMLAEARARFTRYGGLLRDPESFAMTMIEHHLSAGDGQAAREGVLALDDVRNRARMLRRIAQVQAEAGDTNAALATLEDAAEAASGIADEAARSRQMQSIARSIAHAGALRDAIRTAEAIPDPEGSTRAMASVAEAALRQGARDTGLDLLGRAMSRTDEIENASTRIARLIWIADLQRQAGAVAFNAESRIRDSLAAFAPGAGEGARASFALYLSDQGEFSEVARLYESADIPALVIRDLVGSLARHGEMDEVWALLTREGDRTVRDDLLSRVIAALWDVEDRRHEAIALIGRLETPAQQGRWLTRLSGLFLEEQSLGEARIHLHDALQAARLVPGDANGMAGFSLETDQSIVLSTVSEGYLEAGFLADAYLAALYVPDAGIRAVLLARIAAATSDR